MALLIDGFNLIYKFPDLEACMYESNLDGAKKGLINKLKEYKAIRKKEKIRIVFDGKKKPSDSTRVEKSGPIEIFYSHELSADYLIKQFIKQDKNPRMVTVVTSDKDIIFYVNRFRAKVMTSEDFAAMWNKTIEEHYTSRVPEKDENPEISEDEVKFWEKMFSRKK